MIDYLEALLPEEEGEEEALELAGPSFPRPAGAGAAEDRPGPPGQGTGAEELPEPEDMTPEAVWAPLAVKGRQMLGLQAGAWERTAAEAWERPASPAALEAGEPLGHGREQGAAALLERLSRARQTAGYGSGPGGGAVRLSVPQGAEAGGGGLELEALDRAVQRDARRYDGGFALF